MTEVKQGKDRRREPRTQIARPVYVEPADPQGERFEEVRTMRDISRCGFYFVTEKGSYWPGMQVHAIPTFGCFNIEFVGEVVRVEPLPAGEFGVAVRLLRVRDPIASPRTATRSTFLSFARADAPLRETHEQGF
jgi:PilZ domain